ncbi:hypothetical protein VIBNISOn1_1570027 [Vibrio nigripulchritudo SOn1]|nr:hypothetical protein VIBNISOn1_1570027 [Vibrio nigripulchritudo SOn1]
MIWRCYAFRGKYIECELYRNSEKENIFLVVNSKFLTLSYIREPNYTFDYISCCKNDAIDF